ncbi:coproporphyrinogen III oxidase [Emticicia aquatilis]|uniref:Coproporphyrinogen III oxidase n=1 Tax=Emticicia aquatilis TaxID=1537369 RepID=A0A917DY24_9BACT|nr:STM4012 family radical SAM protein [Emticicia aquatilis]GGD82446.1 coproporphyrinogen III oxidase [Emticicia aquatilis]
MNIQNTLFNNPFEGYAYSYPHKHAYRPFETAIPLESLWKEESKDGLFLYLHIPFCEMRCGFCNLFTVANPKGNLEEQYMKALQTEANVVSKAIGESQFSRIAVGGGTPTFLNLPLLESLFSIIQETMKVDTSKTPFSFEMSPKTVSLEKLHFLYQNGVDRVSIGIQSFIENEQKTLGRPQKNKEVFDALSMMRSVNFKTLNIDLIYGAFGQTANSWLFSLESALMYDPEEIFIYPLYTRPLTGIMSMNKSETDNRFNLYLLAKEFLLSQSYEQISMRLFRKKAISQTMNGLQYCCQEDGMVGLGSGARSYTKRVHYSSEYAVGSKNVKNIIQNYISKSTSDFASIDYGIRLNDSELKRRYLIKSILQVSGLDINQYNTFFNSDLIKDHPKLLSLLDSGLGFIENETLFKLTTDGIDWSDAIGPWLYSDEIKTKMEGFNLK